jgi:hypothetical protein
MGAAFLAGNPVAIQTVVAKYSPKADLLLKPAQFRKVLIAAAVRAGQRWIDTWLPMRWHRSYAERLGYQIERQVEGKPINPFPFFDKGTWLRNAMMARPVATAPGGLLKWRIVVPVGHALQAKTVRPFVTIPANEMADQAAALDRALADIFATGIVTSKITKGAGAGQLRATLAQAVAIDARLGGEKRGRDYHNRYTMGDSMRAEAIMGRQRTLAAGRADWQKAKREARKRQLHQWHRTSGGSAAQPGAGLSQTYQGTGRAKAAARQRSYRARKAAARAAH